MAYSLADITRISGSRQAVRDRVYIDVKGNKYKGTIDGRLEQVFTIDKTIGVKLHVDDYPQRLNEYLLELESTTNSLENYDAFITEYLNSVAYAQKTGYTEFIMTGDNISQILIYKDNTKAYLLFTKDFTYTGDDLTEIVVTNSDNTFILTKSFEYDLDGNITTKTIT